MRKKTFRFLWLVALPMLLGLASCAEYDNPAKPGDGGQTTEQPDAPLPTDDQMAVTVTEDLPTAVLGTFDEGSTGAALVKRLPTVTDHIGPDTRLVLVPGSAFEGEGTMSADDLEALVRLTMNGGYLALERPTSQQMLNFAVLYVAKLIEQQQLQYEQTFDLGTAAAARAASQSRAVERFQTRQANIESMAKTRAGGQNAVMDELVIFGPVDYFAQQPFEEETTSYVSTEDSEGNTTEPQAVTSKQERTPYISGTLADAAAEWLNASVKKYEQQNAPRRALGVTRAGGSAINDIMDASEEFTYNEAIDWRTWSNQSRHYTDRVNMIVRSWGVHNMETNKDFYYLKQNVTLRMGNEKGYKIFWPKDDEYTWSVASNYGDYDNWYGSFLSQYVTSMNLTGNGSIRLEAAKPDTDNNSSSTSVSIGSSSSTTYTCGITYGGSFGMSGQNPTASVNFGASHSVGTTTGTSFSLSMSQTSKDLHGVKNTSGNQVTWTYKGTLPQFYVGSYYSHQTAADILVNDCDVANEICWSVSNPSGQYTFNITSQPQTAALLYKNDKSKNPPRKYEYTTTAASTHSQQLQQPNRATQKWRMSITVDEWADGEVAGAKEYLQDAVRKQFSDVYDDVFTVADKSKESLDAITFVINYSKKVFNNGLSDLQDYGKAKGVKTFSIQWYSDDGIQTIDPFVVEVPQPVKPEEPDLTPIAQVLWCEGNSTLYFINKPLLNVGDTWDGQTITEMWSGNDVTNSPTFERYGYGARPGWAQLGQRQRKRVVFDKSFAEVRPKSLCRWFCDNSFYKLETIEGIENLNTSEVTTMAYMFSDCQSLKTLNVDGFDMTKVTDVEGMFYYCENLTTIYCSQTWNVSSSYYMFYACWVLKGAVSYSDANRDAKSTNCSMANPYTGLFTKPEHSTSVNVYIKDGQDNTDLLKQHLGQWVNVRYSRSLSAKTGSDGNYTPTPYTVCLPYDLDLWSAVNSKQAEIYTLAAVTGGQFVFKKLSETTLTAGVPYVVLVNSGRIALSAQGVQIAVAEPGSTKVYTSVADWKKGSGTTVGEWRGTFDQWDADQAAAWDAYALTSTTNFWNNFYDSDAGTIPAFRAFLTSGSIADQSYSSRYED